jgi:hypothetical protein
MERSSRLLTLVSRVLIFLLIAVCLTSHLAARLPARFASGFSGDGGGRVAKFSGGTVYYSVTNMPALNKVQTSGYYAFVASFRVDFDEAEVSRSYDLTLKLDTSVVSDRSATLLFPTGTVGTVLEDGTLVESVAPSDLGFSEDSFTSGSAYFSLGKGSESSTLRAASGSDYSVQLVSNESVAMAAESHYFKVVFFMQINVSAGNSIHAAHELLNLYCDLTVRQVD